ncbi:hypothetical protein CTI12_AA600160 [Artemisia annua]|uniref:Uncharacterized protein n=1 Tax=Artemisia annua TaxID=35608 RepID=A0A2U1KHU7_ARTAN|nr:hypothetical protein CTI12_AA600160 [Artemisia annua]
MAIYIGAEEEEWKKVLDNHYLMDLVLEGYGAESIAEYGAYSKISKELRKQILTWLRKQPGYYEMLISKELRKQILTWLRKQPGYYEMLRISHLEDVLKHLKNKKEKKERRGKKR